MRSRSKLASVTVMVGASIFGSCVVSSDDYIPPPNQRSGDSGSMLQDPVPVLRVIDGDTIEVDLNGTHEKIRFQGIDTPELYPDPDGSPPEPYAEAARNYTELYIGTRVELQFDSHCPDPPEELCRDSTPSRRLLAYIKIADGSDLGARLLSRGLAEVYVYHGQTFDRLQEYELLESQARDEGVGMWE